MKRHEPQEPRLRFKQILRQKQTLRMVAAAGSIAILSLILLVYFNLTKTEEMKASQVELTDPAALPDQFIIPEIRLDQESYNSRSMNSKVARPLDSLSVIH